MNNIFTELSIILVVVASMALLMRLLRQPLILGYIIAGVLVGANALNVLHASQAFSAFSEIGIVLLLFIIGLGLNTDVIKGLGKPAFLTALSVFASLGLVGFIVSSLLGFSWQNSLVLATALLFSSTIIVLKVLSDGHEVTRLYGQLILGVLLIEDVAAMVAMAVIGVLGTGTAEHITLSDLLLKVIGLISLLFVMGRYLMPVLVKRFAANQELLFLFAMAWAFGIAEVSTKIGLSHELGALFAGVSLSSLPYATEISTRLRPLRDFFIVLFFVNLGGGFSFGEMGAALVPALLFSGLVLALKPFLVVLSLGAQGYTKLTSFRTGIHLSQISEFSIVLAAFAVSSHIASPAVVNIITLVSIITITISSYFMKYQTRLYSVSEKILSLFERRNVTERALQAKPYVAIVFGYQHGGHEFVEAFRSMRKRYIVIDYDPSVVAHMETEGIRHGYGDAADEEFLSEIGAERAKFVVSTINDKNINRVLLRYIRRHGDETVFVCHAEDYETASEYYKLGATYVMLPHFLGSERISSYIKRHGYDKTAFQDFRKRHIMKLGAQALKN